MDQTVVGSGASLTDAQWTRIEPLLPDRTPKPGARWRDHRKMIDAIAFKFQSGTQSVRARPGRADGGRGIGLARVGESVPPLRVRHVADSGVPERSLLRQRAPGRTTGGGDREPDARGRAASASRQDPDRLLQDANRRVSYEHAAFT
ncbi:transposase [Streptomyces sp. NPDC054813]